MAVGEDPVQHGAPGRTARALAAGFRAIYAPCRPGSGRAPATGGVLAAQTGRLGHRRAGPRPRVPALATRLHPDLRQVPTSLPQSHGTAGRQRARGRRIHVMQIASELQRRPGRRARGRRAHAPAEAIPRHGHVVAGTDRRPGTDHRRGQRRTASTTRAVTPVGRWSKCSGSQPRSAAGARCCHDRPAADLDGHHARFRDDLASPPPPPRRGCAARSARSTGTWPSLGSRRGALPADPRTPVI